MIPQRMVGESIWPARGGERIAFAACTLFLFAAPFAASGGTRATCLILAAIAIAASGTWREAWDLLPSRAAAMVGAWFVLAPLSLAWTIDWRHTLDELRAESLYGALAFFVFFVTASTPARWRAWCKAIALGTLLTLAAKELQQGLGVALWRHSPDGGVGPYSTHLVLVAPLVATLVFGAPWGFRRSAWVVAGTVVLLIGAAWLTREPWTTPNRIVWPALGAVFLVSIAAGRRARGVDMPSPAALRRVVAVAGLAIACGFVASIVAKNERFYREDPSLIASVEHDLRPRLWQLGWQELKAAPLLGYGFGREILRPVFLPQTPQGVDHPPVQHAHNALLNIALQLGIVGLALFLAVLATLAREYLSMLSEPACSVLGVVGLAFLAGFVAKNLTDDFLHRHNAQLFWAMNGMLLGLAARARRRR